MLVAWWEPLANEAPARLSPQTLLPDAHVAESETLLLFSCQDLILEAGREEGPQAHPDGRVQPDGGQALGLGPSSHAQNLRFFPKAGWCFSPLAFPDVVPLHWGGEYSYERRDFLGAVSHRGGWIQSFQWPLLWLF